MSYSTEFNLLKRIEYCCQGWMKPCGERGVVIWHSRSGFRLPGWWTAGGRRTRGAAVYPRKDGTTDGMPGMRCNAGARYGRLHLQGPATRHRGLSCRQAGNRCRQKIRLRYRCDTFQRCLSPAPTGCSPIWNPGSKAGNSGRYSTR